MWEFKALWKNLLALSYLILKLFIIIQTSWHCHTVETVGTLGWSPRNTLEVGKYAKAEEQQLY